MTGKLKLSRFVGLLALVVAYPARAQTGCAIIGGTLHCGPAGNPYAGGVSRNSVGTPDDARILLDPGVRITTGSATGVVLRSGSGASTLDALNDVQITTNGIRAFGVNAHTDSGPVRLDVDRVTTLGQNSLGIAVITEARTTAAPVLPVGFNPGDIVVRVNDVETRTDFSTGVDLLAAGAGEVQLTHGTISTAGRNSNGINAFSFNRVTLVGTETITTTGFQSDGINASADHGGSLSIREANVQTTGAEAVAIRATAFSGNADVTITGNVSSAQSDGVNIIAGFNSAPGLATFSLLQGGSLTGATSALTIAAGTHATVVNDGSISSDLGYAVLITGGGATIFNRGIIQGRFSLTSADDRFENMGVLVLAADSAFGDGIDVLINSGTLRFAAATTARRIELSGLERFENDGMIDLHNGRAGDTLVLGDYFGGSGGTLALDIDLGGATATADRLNVSTASGSTQVFVIFAGGSLTRLPAPTTIVQATSASSPDAFVLGGTSGSGLVAIRIVYDPDSFAYQIVSGAGPDLYRFAELVRAGDALWDAAANDMSAHLTGERQDGGTGRGRLWIQASGKNESYRRRFGSGDPDWAPYRQDAFGALVGLDLGSEALGYGLAAGYSGSNIDFTGTADRAVLRSLNFAGYLTFRRGDLFAQAFGLYANYRVRSRFGLAATGDRGGGDSWGGSAAVGAELHFGAGFFEPVASLRFARTRLHGLGPENLGFSLADFDGIRGSVGFRLGSTVAFSPRVSTRLYLGGSVIRDFSDPVEFTAFGSRFAGAALSRNFSEGRIGFQARGAGNITGFIEGNARIGRGYRAGGAQAGIRVGF